MASDDSKPTFRELYDYLVKVLRTAAVAEDLRKEAAVLLIRSQMVDFLGIRADLQALASQLEVKASTAESLYNDPTDLMLEERV